MIIDLKTQDRDLGSSTKWLRGQDWVPGVIYGPDINSTPLQIKSIDLKKALKTTGEIYQVSAKGKSFYVKIAEVQLDPSSHNFVHVSLQELPKTGASTVSVPIELVGSDVADKSGGVLVLVHDHVNVSGNVSAIPDSIKVDVSELTIGHALKFENLNLPAGLELKEELSDTIVALRPPHKEEEPAAVEEEQDAEVIDLAAHREGAEEQSASEEQAGKESGKDEKKAA